MSTLSPATIPVSNSFNYVEEWDEFLNLFPHRGSYLWAAHPSGTDRPEWRTEPRHLLSDRLIMQGAYLYGVRFGKTTNYLMIDIDARSRYHPYKDPYAIGTIVEILEPLGLCSYVGVTSSYSGGLHIYFPFANGVTSWKIAAAAQSLLESKGFKCDRGQLELFPNARKCDGADYNGHRLPLQHGSYLIDENFSAVYTDRDRFVDRWRFASNRNSVSESQCEEILKRHNHHAPRKMGISAQKFLADLNADIEPGWTGYGQTNKILGRIAMREYIFHHVIHGGEPLRGFDLQLRIYKVASELPGYREFCRHQHELPQLAADWARSVELSDYYPYKADESKFKLAKDKTQSEWNFVQQQSARHRIEQAVHKMLDAGVLPATARERIAMIKDEAKCSVDTLYKYRELWHPETLKPSDSEVFHPAQAEITTTDTPQTRSTSPVPPCSANKLITLGEAKPTVSASPSTSDPAVGGSGGFSTDPIGVEAVRAVLEAIKRRKAAAFHQMMLGEDLPQYLPINGGLNDGA